MTERTNAEWLADLTGENGPDPAAIADLRGLLARGLSFALQSRENVADDDLEDFAQMALLRILDRLDTFRGESRFTTWAQKVAVRVAYSELRRRRWRDVPLISPSDNGDGDFVPDVLRDSAPGPEARAIQASVADALMATIRDELTDRQRRALVAIRLQGMPVDLVAEKMGTNRNALYKLLHDARKRLKARLLDAGISPEEIIEAFGA